MVKIPTTGIVFFTLTLICIFFVGRQLSTLSKNLPVSQPAQPTSTFNSVKSDKPELKFFVMSFCPYGNQIETALRPVFNLLENQATFTPHYIFEKIDNLASYCQTRSADASVCESYVKKNYYTNIADCEKSISTNNANCLNEKNYLKTSNGALYGSLHGRQEANQNVRELCAWEEVGSIKQAWWNFIENVNKNCTVTNADTCWEDQGKAAGLNTDKITECFNKNTVSIIEKEIALTKQYNIHVSPTVLINGVIYPPEDSYAQNSQGVMKVGNDTISQNKYRNSNSLKIAVCSSFNRPSEVCQSKLNDDLDSAPNTVGCEN